MPIAQCLGALLLNITSSFRSLKDDIHSYPQQLATSLHKSKCDSANEKAVSGSKVKSRTITKPLIGSSPERRSLGLQIKMVERKKKQLLQELKITQRNLKMLLDEQMRYDALPKSNTRPDVSEGHRVQCEKALQLVRRMNRERKAKQERKRLAEESIRKHKGNSVDNVETLNLKQQAKIVQMQDRSIRGEKRTRSRQPRNQTEISKASSVFFAMTEVNSPITSRNPKITMPGQILPKLQHKKYPKTQLYRLIEQQNRIKRLTQELKEKSKIYNSRRKNLYNIFSNNSSNRVSTRQKTEPKSVRRK